MRDEKELKKLLISYYKNPSELHVLRDIFKEYLNKGKTDLELYMYEFRRLVKKHDVEGLHNYAYTLLLYALYEKYDIYTEDVDKIIIKIFGHKLNELQYYLTKDLFLLEKEQHIKELMIENKKLKEELRKRGYYAREKITS